MELKEILSITGNNGLYRFVSQSRGGIIVEHLETKQRTHVSSTTRVSSLGDVAIYTTDEEVPLANVLLNIEAKTGGSAVNTAKVNNDFYWKYFADILPSFDRERVYVSDIKKVISWYNTLQKCDMLGILKTATEEAEKANDEKAAE
jgi:hypothetical protein